MTEAKPVQTKTMMMLICFFLGGLGIHRMMMGYKNWWYMILATAACGLGCFWALYDLFMIITDKMPMADGTPLTKG